MDESCHGIRSGRKGKRCTCLEIVEVEPHTTRRVVGTSKE